MAKDLTQHMVESDHSDKDTVECCLCKSIVVSQTLIDHYQECAEKNRRTVKCPFCEVEYFPYNDTNCSRMVYHKKSVHFWGKFKCPECQHVAGFARDLVDHMTQRHDLSILVCCPSCKDNFAPEELQAHYGTCFRVSRVLAQKKCQEKKKLGMSEFKCDHCDSRFKANSRGYWEHMKLKHSWGIFKCQTCLHKFHYPQDLVDHVTVMEHSTEALCPTKSCKKTLPVWELGNHYKECYTELNRIRTKQFNKRKRSQEFICDICGKVCKGKVGYKKHLALHGKKLLKEQKPKPDEPASYFCDKCGKTFMHKNALKGHVRYAHSGMVQCELCNYSCPKKKLSRHMLVHQEPKFGCGSCGKMLKTKQSLVAHEREHAGIRPYECNVCGKQFSDNAAVTQHKRLVHKIAGPNAKPMRREQERGITSFIVEGSFKS